MKEKMSRRNFIGSFAVGFGLGGAKVASAEKVTVKTTEAILVTIPNEDAIEEYCKEVHTKFKEIFPNNKVLVMTDNVKVEFKETA